MLYTIFLLSSLLQQPYNVPSDAKANCKVLNTGSSDRYEFVRIYEMSTNQIVFQSAIKGGESKDVYVGTKEIKVEHKWAGDPDYHSGVVAECQNGNTVRIQGQ